LANSDLADDAIKMLDGYAAHQKTAAKLAADAAKKAAEDEKNKQRLESNLTPKGSGAPASTTINDDDAFGKGFKKVAKRA
jgi:hypothetical protein